MPVPVCGPKCSVCCAVFSAWGFIMLVREPATITSYKSANWHDSNRDCTSQKSIFCKYYFSFLVVSICNFTVCFPIFVLMLVSRVIDCLIDLLIDVSVVRVWWACSTTWRRWRSSKTCPLTRNCGKLAAMDGNTSKSCTLMRRWPASLQWAATCSRSPCQSWCSSSTGWWRREVTLDDNDMNWWLSHTAHSTASQRSSNVMYSFKSRSVIYRM